MNDPENQTTKRERAKGRPVPRPVAPASQQVVEGSRIREGIAQSSDQAGTHQRVASSSAKRLDQNIATKLSEISAFGVRGRGLMAVIVAGVIVVVFLALKYLVH
jgi:hypothetical protein